MVKNPVSKYIKGYGINDIKYFILGDTDSTITSDTSDSFRLGWRDAYLSYKITKNDICGVVPNNQWNYSSFYNYWQSNLNTSITNFYVYVPETGIVYLCISNNSHNRSDLSGDFVSTVKPVHQYGIVRYSDGYMWLALYKITPDLYKFVNNNWIPVISFDNLDITNQTNNFRRTVNFCSESSTTTIGNCGIYFNSDTQIPLSDSTFENYSKGDLFTTLNLSCSDCFWLFEGKNDNYTSVFYGSSAPETSITIQDTITEIESYINNNIISVNSAYKKLYDYYMLNGLLDGCIISAFIDLSSLTSSQKEVSIENPSIIINSGSGSGAKINLTTFINSSGNYEIIGIEITENGSGYYDYNLDIDSGILLGMSKSTLLSLINLNLDVTDGMGFDPVTVLNCKNIETNVSIETQSLVDNDIKIPESVNYYALIDNPLQVVGDLEVLAGKSSGTKFTRVINKRYTQIPLALYSSGSTEKTKLENKANWSDININSTNSKSQKIKIVDVGFNASASRTFLKIVGDIKDEIQNVTDFSISGTKYDVIGPPTVATDLKQFSGRLAKANKFTRRTLSNSNESSPTTNIGMNFKIIEPI
jgi:hypothetical protein